MSTPHHPVNTSPSQHLNTSPHQHLTPSTPHPINISIFTLWTSTV
ncbi:hypothetical protein [Leyella stercorea]|nr:hypothetical protein [Leyella stercorea]